MTRAEAFAFSKSSDRWHRWLLGHRTFGPLIAYWSAHCAINRRTKIASSLAIVAVIAWGSWGLLRDAVRMGLLGVPEGIDERKVRGFLAAQPGVSAVHDLHIWGMSTTESALTAHLVMPGWTGDDSFLRGLASELESRFSIHHATIQIERSAADCRLHSDPA